MISDEGSSCWAVSVCFVVTHSPCVSVETLRSIETDIRALTRVQELPAGKLLLKFFESPTSLKEWLVELRVEVSCLVFLSARDTANSYGASNSSDGLRSCR